MRPVKYLVVMNYNIPAVKPGIFPAEYLYARFTAEPMLRSVEGEKTEPGTLANTLGYQPLRVTAIYPKNQPLNASKSNTQTWDVKAQPSYGGISAGSIEYISKDELNYMVSFPKVVGLGAESGAMEWTYYPAKSQRVTFGSQMAFAVLTVPAAYSDCVLQMNAALSYRYKYLKVIAADAGEELVSSFVALSSALHSVRDIDMFRRTVMRAMGTDDQKAIERILRHDDPLTLFADASKSSTSSSTDSTDASKDKPTTTAAATTASTAAATTSK